MNSICIVFAFLGEASVTRKKYIGPISKASTWKHGDTCVEGETRTFHHFDMWMHQSIMDNVHEGTHLDESHSPLVNGVPWQ